jgi:hypothetical protein
VQVHEAVGPAGPGQVDGIAAELLGARDVAREVGDDLVGDDHRDGDRDQCLAEFLALVPAQERLLHHEADDGDAGRGDEERHEPLPGVHLAPLEREALAGHALLHLVGDVAPEEVEGAVRHVHDAHEAEDQREAARDDEEGGGEGERVEDDLEERRRIVHRRAEGRGPPAGLAVVPRDRGEEEDEDECEDDAAEGDQDGEAPPAQERADLIAGRSSCGQRAQPGTTLTATPMAFKR